MSLIVKHGRGYIHPFRANEPCYLDLKVCGQIFRIVHPDNQFLERYIIHVDRLTPAQRQKLKKQFREELSKQRFPLIKNPLVLLLRVQVDSQIHKIKKQRVENLNDINDFFDFLEILSLKEAMPKEGNYPQEAANRNFIYHEKDPHFFEPYYARPVTLKYRREQALERCRNFYDSKLEIIKEKRWRQ